METQGQDPCEGHYIQDPEGTPGVLFLGSHAMGAPGTPIRRSPSGVLSPGSHIGSPLKVHLSLHCVSGVPSWVPSEGSLPRFSSWGPMPGVMFKRFPFGGLISGVPYWHPLLEVGCPVLGSPLRVQPGGPVILGVMSHPMVSS